MIQTTEGKEGKRGERRTKMALERSMRPLIPRRDRGAVAG